MRDLLTADSLTSLRAIDGDDNEDYRLNNNGNDLFPSLPITSVIDSLTAATTPMEWSSILEKIIYTLASPFVYLSLTLSRSNSMPMIEAFSLADSLFYLNFRARKRANVCSVCNDYYCLLFSLILSLIYTLVVVVVDVTSGPFH